MAPSSLMSIRIPDPLSWSPIHHQILLISPSTQPGIHLLFVFSLLCPWQFSITSHLGSCLKLGLAAASFSYLISLISCLSILQHSYSQLFSGLLRCCIPSPMSGRLQGKLFPWPMHSSPILFIAWLAPLILQNSD